jgi:polymorphic toxin system nucleotidyltransferase-like protein
MIDNEIARLLTEWAAGTDAVASFWLFGSRARGTARADSDYDLAIELRPKIKAHDWAFGDYTFEVDKWKASLRAWWGFAMIYRVRSIPGSVAYAYGDERPEGRSAPASLQDFITAMPAGIVN